MEVEQAFLRMILDAMGDGLVVISEFGEIEFVDNRLLLITGYQQEDLFGQQVGMLFYPDDRDELMHSLLRGIGSTHEVRPASLYAQWQSAAGAAVALVVRTDGPRRGPTGARAERPDRTTARSGPGTPEPAVAGPQPRQPGDLVLAVAA